MRIIAVLAGPADVVDDAGSDNVRLRRGQRLQVHGGGPVHSSRHRCQKLFAHVQRARPGSENCRFRDGQGHLQKRLLQEGRQGHVADQVDATGEFLGRDIHYKDRCLVRLGNIFYPDEPVRTGMVGRKVCPVAVIDEFFAFDSNRKYICTCEEIPAAKVDLELSSP